MCILDIQIENIFTNWGRKFTNGNVYTLIQEINENSNYITCEFYSEGIVEEDVTYSTVLKVVDPVYTTNDYWKKLQLIMV